MKTIILGNKQVEYREVSVKYTFPPEDISECESTENRSSSHQRATKLMNWSSDGDIIFPKQSISGLKLQQNRKDEPAKNISQLTESMSRVMTQLDN